MKKLLFVLFFSILTPQIAKASLKFCNEGEDKIYVAIGYWEDNWGYGYWASRGWWVIEPGECVTVFRFSIRNEPYYYYAESIKGKSWTGKYNFCVDDDGNKPFKISGEGGCRRRGYRSVKFTKVLTSRSSHTVVFQ